jgi:hypothetical protein
VTARISRVDFILSVIANMTPFVNFDTTKVLQYMTAIHKITTGELLTKQAMRKAKYYI